jgi:hypothetical protein
MDTKKKVLGWGPPPRNPPIWDEVLAELKARPNEWALIAEEATSPAAPPLRTAGCVVTSRKVGVNDTGRPVYDVWAKYEPGNPKNRPR